jgi:hypothetical protein
VRRVVAADPAHVLVVLVKSIDFEVERVERGAVVEVRQVKRRGVAARRAVPAFARIQLIRCVGLPPDTDARCLLRARGVEIGVAQVVVPEGRKPRYLERANGRCQCVCVFVCLSLCGLYLCKLAITCAPCLTASSMCSFHRRAECLMRAAQHGESHTGTIVYDACGRLPASSLRLRDARTSVRPL